MADVLTDAQRSLNMSRIRGRDTKPELVIRRGLHRLGFRFRLYDRKLPGQPDLVLPAHKVAILVHGCFWHGHDCPMFKWPATRKEFWRAKIRRNRERDKATFEALRQAGWRVLIVWECALRGIRRLQVEDVLSRCESVIRNRDKALLGNPRHHSQKDDQDEPLIIPKRRLKRLLKGFGFSITHAESR